VGDKHAVVEGDDVACLQRDEARVCLFEDHGAEHLLLGVGLAAVVGDDLAERDLQG
jgi:hypothetical protein